MQTDEDRKWLYEKFKSNNYDVGSYDDFFGSLLSSEEDRQWYYDKASGELGLDVGDYDEFTTLFVPPSPSAPAKVNAVPSSSVSSGSSVVSPASPAAYSEVPRPGLREQVDSPFPPMESLPWMQNTSGSPVNGLLDAGSLGSRLKASVRRGELDTIINSEEEKKLDNSLVPGPVADESDVLSNYADRFSHTARGKELQAELSDIRSGLVSKYFEEFKQTPEYLSVAGRRWPGAAERDAAIEKEFNRLYGDRVSSGMKPYEDAYNRELENRYGSLINADFSKLEKEKLPSQVEGLLSDVEKQLDSNHRFLRSRSGSGGNAFNALMNSSRYNSDPDISGTRREIGALESSRRLLEEADEIIKEAGKSGSTSFAGGLGRGLRDNFDIDKWSMGLVSMADSKYLLDALDRADKGEPLTSAQEKLLESAVVNMATQGYFSSNLGRGYKAGRVTAESLPFMLEFLVNPVSSSGSSIAKSLLKFGMKRFGASAMRKGVSKAAARLAGDAAASAGMALSSGLPRVVSGTLERLSDNYGYSLDDSGNLNVQKRGDTGVAEALGRSFGSTFIENQSEMIFNAFKGFSPFMKVVDESLPGGVNEFMKRISSSRPGILYRELRNNPTLKAVLERAQFHGLPEEYLEEVYNNLANVSMGEMSMDDALDLDNNIDTFLGLAPTSVAFGLLGVGSLAVDRVRNRRTLRRILDMLPEDRRSALAGLERLSKEEGNTAVREFIKGMMSDATLSPEQKKAAIRYAFEVTRGNAMEDMSLEQDAMSRASDDAYVEGYESSPGDRYAFGLSYDSAASSLESRNPSLFNDVRRMLDEGYSLSRLRDVLGDSVTPSEWSLISDYCSRKMRLDGVVDAVDTDILEKVSAFSDGLSPAVVTDASGVGTVTSATYKGAPVYVLANDGTVATILSDGRKSLVSSADLSDVLTSNVEDIVNSYKAGLVSSGRSDLDKSINHHPKTESPYPGLLLRRDDADLLVVSVDSDGTVHAYPAGFDNRTGAMVPKQGANEVVLSADEAMNIQDAYYDRLSPPASSVGDAPGTPSSKVLPDGRTAVPVGISADGMEVVFDITDRNGNVVDSDSMPVSEYDSLSDYLPDTVDDISDGNILSENESENADSSPIESNVLSEQDTGAVSSSAVPSDMPSPAASVRSTDVPPAVVSSPSPMVEEEGGSVMIPVDASGNPLYHMVSVETALSDLLDGSLNDEELDGFIAANISEASSALNRISGKAPKIGTNKARYISSRNEWQSKVDEAQSRVDFWNRVKDAVRTERIQPGDQTVSEIRSMGDPLDGHELAAQLLASGKLPLLREDYMRETGYGGKETAGLFGLFRSKAGGGMTLGKAGEKLMLADEENGTHFFDPDDANAGRNAILDVLSSVRTRGDLSSYIRNNRERIAERERQAELDHLDAERDLWAFEHFGMNYSDYVTYEDVIYDIIREKMIPEDVILDFYADIADEISSTQENGGNSLPSSDNSVSLLDNDQKVPYNGRVKEETSINDSRGTGVGSEIGEGVLSSPRVDNSGGSETAPSGSIDERSADESVSAQEESGSQELGDAVGDNLLDVSRSPSTWAEAVSLLADEEERFSDLILDYVAEHYPTQATVSAVSTSPEGLRERELMRSDETLRRMRSDAASALAALEKKVSELYSKEHESDILFREAGDDEISSFAGRYNLDESDVRKYAQSMRMQNLGGASFAFQDIRRSVRLQNSELSLGEFAKVFSPVRKELYERFGNVDSLREAYVQREMESRNVMESARKRAQEEAAAEKKRLEEFEVMTDGELDSAYFKAMEENDESRMRDIINEAARRNGYISADEFRMAHRAPSYDEEGIDKSMVDIAANKDRIRDSLAEQSRMNMDKYRSESVSAINEALSAIDRGESPTVTVYRAVPKSLKEGKVRNGDWVSLSESYVKVHGEHVLNGNYRVMREEVPAENLYWDGNDINEWGYDDRSDYRYRDTKNNRKLNDLVTRDDKGEVIPPSKRFNPRKADVRFRSVDGTVNDKSLFAVHNISEAALKEALDLGGFPMPSIAVTDKEIGHTEFGDISLLFDKSTIDPSDGRNRVYTGDAWTPVFPEVGIKISEKVADGLRRKIDNILEGHEYAKEFGLPLDDYNLSDKINRSKSFKDAYKNSNALKIAFLIQKGIPFKPVTIAKRYSPKVDNRTLLKIVKEVNKRTSQDLNNLGYDEVMALEPVVRKVVREYLQQEIDRISGSLSPEKQAESMSLRFLKRNAEKELTYSDLLRLFSSASKYELEGEMKVLDTPKTEEKLNGKFSRKLQKEYEDWLDEISDGIIEKKGIRNDRDLFTPSGNRRDWDALFDAITLDNVVKAMTRQSEKGGGVLFGGEIFGASQKSIPSIDAIRELAKQRLSETDTDSFKEEKNRISDRLFSISTSVAETGSYNVNDVRNDIIDAVSRSHASGDIYKSLKKLYPSFTREAADEIAGIVRDVQAMNTRYFEAKPYRAVGFDEIKAAVVPKGTDKELISRLESLGIEVRTYKKDDQEDRKRVVNAAARKADILFRFIGETGAGNLDRAEEVTVRLDNLAVAREMESAFNAVDGRSDRDDAVRIKLATGWERGSDGKWRYEVDDFEIDPSGLARRDALWQGLPWGKEYDALLDKLFEGVDLSEEEYARFDELSVMADDLRKSYEANEVRYLDDYVKDDGLFKSYPSLKELRVELYNDPSSNTGATFYSGQNLIRVNESALGYADFRGILAHEIQHAVQSIEGFARGGNSATYRNHLEALKEKRDAWSMVEEFSSKREELGSDATQMDVYNALVDEYVSDGFEFGDGFIPSRDSFDKGFNLWVRGYDNEGYEDAYNEYQYLTGKFGLGGEKDNYNNLSGEVEARNVQSRMDMSPEERRNSLAMETEDVSREDQIFLYNGSVGDYLSPAGGRSDIISAVEGLSGKLHTPVHVVRGSEELPDGIARRAIESGRNIKAWYDAVDGSVFLYLPAAVDRADAERSVLHEVVGHKGLRSLFGEKDYSGMMERLHALLPPDVRASVSSSAMERYGGRISVAMDEYLAEQAELSELPSWWGRVVSALREFLRRIGIAVRLSDNDVRYLLWRSRRRLERGDIWGHAQDMSMRRSLGLGDSMELAVPESGGDSSRFRESGSGPASSSADTVASLSSRIRSLEKKLSKYEDTEDLRREVTSFIRDEISSDLAGFFTKEDLNSLLVQAQNAKSGKSLERVALNVKNVVLNARRRQLQRQIDRLLSLRVVDVNGKNMSVAKNVDDSTRRIFTLLRGRVSDLKLSGFEDDMTYLRRDTNNKRAEISRLERSLLDVADKSESERIGEEIAALRSAIASNGERLSELKGEADKVRSAILLSGDLDIEGERSVLEKKMDEAAQGISAWTREDSERLAALNILQGVMVTKGYDYQAADIETESRTIIRNNSDLYKSRAAEANYSKRRRLNDQINENRRRLTALDRLTSDIRSMQVKQMEMTVEELDDLIAGGRNSLLIRTEAEAARRSELIGNAIRSVQGKPIDIFDDKATRESTLKRFFSAPLGSFEYMCKRVTTGTLGKDGFLYKRFVEGDEGTMRAYDTYVLGMKEFKERLNEKCREIFGYDFEGISSRSDKVVESSGVYVFQSEEGQGYGVRYQLPLSKGQAMYIYQVWKMTDGRTKLELQGFDEESVSQIVAFLGGEYIKFADWVQDDFLKELRLRYNEKYVSMYNTSLADIEDYVPLRIRKAAVRQESSLSSDTASRNTLEERAGSLINRTVNTNPVDITCSGFDVLWDHGNKMEEWNAYARVRRDLDYILSNTTFRNQLNANVRGSYENFYESAEVATRSNHPDSAKYGDQVLGKLSKGIVGGNIAFRMSTALKQVLSAPAFLGYSQSPVYLRNLLRNAVNPLGSFRWCMGAIPSFYERVSSGTAGNEKLGERSFSRLLDKYIEYGMIPNKLIDAITCSVGARSIYDYKYSQMKGSGASDEVSHNAALAEADIFYNATQQSSHPAFLSPMQMSRTFTDRMLTTYQNSNIGYVRQLMASFYDLTRSLKWQELKQGYVSMYRREGLSAEEAERRAYSRLLTENRKSVVRIALFGWGLNLLWNIGSEGLLGLFRGDGDDDGDDMWTKDLSFVLTSPVKGLPGGNLLESISNGYGMNPFLVYDELDKFMRESKSAISENGLISPELGYVTLSRLSRYGGVDLEVWGNVYIGVDGMVRDGLFTDEGLIDAMYLLNFPRSNRDMVARELFKDTSLDAFTENVARANKYVSRDNNLEGWVPGSRRLSRSKKKELRDDYLRLHMTDEQKAAYDAKKKADRIRSRIRELSGDKEALRDYLDRHKDELGIP